MNQHQQPQPRGERRRRNRNLKPASWTHEQCPVGVDDKVGVKIDALQSAEWNSNAVTAEPPTLPPTNRNGLSWEFQHHFFPEDRKRKLGSPSSSSSSSPFLETRDLFFHNNHDDKDDDNVAIASPTRSRRKTQEEQSDTTGFWRFGHPARPDWSSGTNMITNNADYNMGLVSVAICFFSLVLTWLIVLGILWKVRSSTRKHNHQGGGYVRDLNTTFQSSEPGESQPQQQQSNNNIVEEETSKLGGGSGEGESPCTNIQGEEGNDEQLIQMECESAASPRWLSFPKSLSKTQSGLRSVASFFTINSSSLASKDGNKYNNNDDDDDDDNNEDDAKNTSYTTQYYRVGIVRDGKVDVSKACDNLSASYTDPEQQRISENNVPWKEILGGLWKDMIHYDDDDDLLQNFSFGSGTIGSATLGSAKSASTTNSPLGSEILRDLEAMEQRVSSSTTRDFRLLTEMEENNNNNNNNKEYSSNGSSRRSARTLDASTISSLVTTAMQQKNQESLLSEEGVEIWYDVSTETFFRIEHNQSSGGDRNYVQFEPSTMAGRSMASKEEEDKSIDEARSLGNKRSIFDVCPWSGALFRYRTLAPSSESISEDGESKKAAENSFLQLSKSKAELDQHAKTPQYRNQGFCAKVGTIAFYAAGVGILVSSFSMALFGANELADASNKASYFVGDAQNLALEGSMLMDRFLDSSPFLAKLPFDDAGTHGDGALVATFDNMTQQLYKSTNSFCDFGNQDKRVDEALTTVAKIFDQHMAEAPGGDNVIDRNILNGLEGIQSDLSRVSETTASLEETWIRPFNSVVLALRVGNSLLCVSCLLLLVGAAKQNLGHAKHKWVVLPLFTVLVVMSLVACLTFLVGSTALQDFCVAGPDEQILEFLSSSTQQEGTVYSTDQLQEQQPWSDVIEDVVEDILENEEDQGGRQAGSVLLYDVAKEYIQQCPSGGGMEGAPSQIVAMVDRGWEFTRALWDVSVLLTSTGTCVNERTSSRASPIFEIGELVMETSCNFSVLLTGIVNVFSCENWYPLYQEGFHRAACDSGRTGFLWVATTQSIIVVFALIMLTIRVIGAACSSKNEYCFEDYDVPPTNEGRSNNRPRNKTMLFVDEESFLKEGSENRLGIAPSPNRYDGSKFLSKLSYCQFLKEEPRPNPMADPNDSRGRSSDRMLRKSPNLNKNKKRGSNYLASTALYSIGGATFEAAHEHDEDYSDDDDENIEVCLYPSKILNRFENNNNNNNNNDNDDDEKENRWRSFNCRSESNRTPRITNVQQKPPKPPSTTSKTRSKYYSTATKGWSEANTFSGTATATGTLSGGDENDGFQSEVQRVRERLKGMNGRENKLIKKNQSYYNHDRDSAPRVQVTVTTQ